MRSAVAFLWLLATLAEPAAAVAQAAAPGAEAQVEARRFFEEGRAHAAAERWTDAVTAFERSRALMERPSTLFNLASALVRVGRAREALSTLDALERIADPARDRAQLAGLPDLRARAQSLVRHVVITVTPETASVEVDGAPVEGSGARRDLTLDPGAHAATISLAGHEAERVEIAIGDDEYEVTLAVRPARVRIVPSLTSAAVSVDGAPRGVGEVELELPPGPHVLEVTAHGHAPLTRQLEVGAGDEQTIAADLVAIPVTPPDPGPDVPLIASLAGGAVVIAAAVAIGLGVAFGVTTEAPSGGTTNTVIAVPLAAVRF